MSKLSVEWYLKAAEKGHPEALKTLGDLYFNGTEVEKDYDKAKNYYEEAIRRGCKNQEAVNRNLELIEQSSAPKVSATPVKKVKKGSKKNVFFYAAFAATIVIATAFFAFFRLGFGADDVWVQDKIWYSDRCSKLAEDVKDIISKPYSYDKKISDNVLKKANTIQSKLKEKRAKESDVKTLLQQLENDYANFKLSCVWQSGKPHPKYTHVISSQTEGKWEPEAGYVFLHPGSNDLTVQWKAGLEHPFHDHVVSSEKEGVWQPEYGYEYVNPGSNNLSVRWKSGIEHPLYDHVASSKTEGVWIPENGYEFVNPGTGDLTVKWKAGIDHPHFDHVVSSVAKGVWIPEDGYEFVLPGSDDLSVKWKVGAEHPKFDHVISSKTEGVWIPDSGYEFVNPGTGDLTVKEKAKWTRPKEWYEDQVRAVSQDVLGYKNGPYYYSSNLMNETLNYVNYVRNALSDDDPIKAESNWQNLNDAFTKLKNSCSWKAGVTHPDYPHVVSGTQKNTWEPERGWEFVSPGSSNYTVKKSPVKCNTCGGTGKVSCGACNGRGKKTQTVVCSNCNGEGQEIDGIAAAVDLASDILTIIGSKGRNLGGSGGTKMKRCSQCNGRGQVQENIACQACGGTGKTNCSQCGGKGNYYQ